MSPRCSSLASTNRSIGLRAHARRRLAAHRTLAEVGKPSVGWRGTRLRQRAAVDSTSGGGSPGVQGMPRRIHSASTSILSLGQSPARRHFEVFVADRPQQIAVVRIVDRSGRTQVSSAQHEHVGGPDADPPVACPLHDTSSSGPAEWGRRVARRIRHPSCAVAESSPNPQRAYSQHEARRRPTGGRRNEGSRMKRKYTWGSTNRRLSFVIAGWAPLF